MPDHEFAARRRRLGAFGEATAATFLVRNGVRIVGCNVAVGRGEIDILAEDEHGLFAVEVKSGIESGDDHPRWNFTDRKAERVARMARSLGAGRVDLITVVVGADGLGVEWHRRVA